MDGGGTGSEGRVEKREMPGQDREEWDDRKDRVAREARGRLWGGGPRLLGRNPGRSRRVPRSRLGRRSLLTRPERSRGRGSRPAPPRCRRTGGRSLARPIVGKAPIREPPPV